MEYVDKQDITKTPGENVARVATALGKTAPRSALK